jgi:hypothetical protein
MILNISNIRECKIFFTYALALFGAGAIVIFTCF